MLHSAVSSVPIRLEGGGGLGEGVLGGAMGGPSRCFFWGGGGCQAPPNSLVCSPGVIRQFTMPLAPIEGRVSSAWVFLATLGTSGGWVLRGSWD